MKFIFLLALLFQFGNLSFSANVELEEREDSLIKELLTNYNRKIRPDAMVLAWLTLYIRQISSLDEKAQVMTSSNYIAIRWFDNRLSWNTKNWSNISSLNIPLNNIWYPDLFIVNTADSNGFIQVTNDNMVSVNSSGYVYALLTAINLRTRCQMNVKYFPFDTQKCPITISSWTLNIDKINLSDNEEEEKKVNSKSYSPNQVWQLQDLEVTATLNYDRYPLDSSPIEEIHVIFVLKRFPMYYMITGIFPCFVLNIVTLLSFALPYATQVVISMNTFLTMSVYSLRVSSDIPVQSEYLPILIVYFLFSIMYTLISLMWFILSDFMLSRGKMPECILSFSKFLKNRVFRCFFPHEVLIVPKLAENKVDNIELFHMMKTIKNDESSKEKNLNLLKNRLNNNNTSPSSKNIDVPKEIKPECFKCGVCESCKNDDLKEKDKKKAKDLFNSYLLALNYFVFLTIFFVMLITNMAIWITIGS